MKLLKMQHGLMHVTLLLGLVFGLRKMLYNMHNQHINTLLKAAPRLWMQTDNVMLSQRRQAIALSSFPVKQIMS
ncbi:hypothetical protein AWI28_17025 [Enterobacter genomosp. O]|uniref:Uncharacterized protein n=1 Tax=Enterobacter genomosp. O TaxID=2364150 RepID=A0A0X4ENP7_9ENTR|nr:hypothetical protein AWI28_17025 [Enterobacter genomosp. O]KZQ29730.1 hypothetical protein A3464_22070 [Enterobacter genomosp. O]